MTPPSRAISDPPVLPLYILAGGHSSRFGSDKALAILQGRPLILHVAEQFRPWAHAVTVIADSPDKYRQLGLRTVADPIAHRGPLAGLVTALHDCPTGWLLLAACDALVVDRDSLGRLMREPRENCVAIAFRSDRWEPLPALLHSAILPAAEHHLMGSSGSLWQLLESVPHRAVPFDGRSFPFAQINTLSDLHHIAASPR